jgi:hypothetical protein
VRYAAIGIGLLLAGVAGSDPASAQQKIGEVKPPALPAAVQTALGPDPLAEEAAAVPPLAPALPPELPAVPGVPGALLEGAIGASPIEATANMRDPFRPFTLDLQPKKTADDEFLTPLQRYDLQQLTVVGVLLDLEPPRAMLQDDAGMGYIVTPGTLIGRQHGVVTDVQPRQIIVEETYVDFYGREQVRRAVLEMPEEEDEVAAQAGRATGLNR